ncbi:K Homology domain [Trypanosoma melophagium]|uniref:K Homology domain n=1 Tax=Trypanosoma melophagium TaxID=715481 RepID=UPI00351AAD4B|nr:K Homology domain [Trypanosoma melophagium]
MDAFPAILPSSMRLDVITDPKIREQLEEAKTLREQRLSISEALRSVIQAKDKCFVDHVPKLENFNAEMTANIDALTLKKDKVFAALEELKALQAKCASLRQELQAMDHGCSALSREIRDAENVLTRETQELKRLREERTTRVSRLRFSTMDQVQRELNRIDKEIAKCGSGASLLRAKRAQVEHQAKEELRGLAAADDRIAAKCRRVEISREELNAKTAEHQAKEEERLRLREELQAMEKNPVERNAQFTSLRNEFRLLQNELKAALRSRKQERPVIEEMESLRQTQEKHIVDLRAIDKRLDVLRKQLPCRAFTYPPKLKSAIVGKGSATLVQLQLDFGVAVCIDGVSPGSGYIVGSTADIDAAMAAIVDITNMEEMCNHEIKLKYDPTLRSRLVGARGANVQSIEEESGASVQVGNGQITIRGTQEAVAAAELLVQRFLSSQHRAELSLGPSELPHVIGKDGSVIKRMEEETGVSSIHVDRTTSKIIIRGFEPCVNEAVRRYKELIEDIRRSTIVLRCDHKTARFIKGSKGRNVRTVENTTGALLQVGDSNITIRGTSRAVEAACLMLNDLRRVEVRVPLDITLMQLLTTALIEVPDSNCGSLRTPNHKNDKEEGEEGGARPREVSSSAAASSSSSPLSSKQQLQQEQEELSGKHISTMLTPIEAIKQASHCEYMTPIRTEGVVLLRGKEEHVNKAHVMLKEFALQCHPKEINVPFPEVLFVSLTRPRSGSSSSSSFIGQLTASHSPLLRVQLKRSEEMAVVSSPIPHEAASAAEKLQEFIAAKEASSVRRVKEFPPQRIGTLMGTGSKRLRELEERTGTHILVRRAVGEVQVFHEEGDETALAAALDSIKEVATI